MDSNTEELAAKTADSTSTETASKNSTPTISTSTTNSNTNSANDNSTTPTNETETLCAATNNATNEQTSIVAPAASSLPTLLVNFSNSDDVANGLVARESESESECDASVAQLACKLVRAERLGIISRGQEQVLFWVFRDIAFFFAVVIAMAIWTAYVVGDLDEMQTVKGESGEGGL